MKPLTREELIAGCRKALDECVAKDAEIASLRELALEAREMMENPYGHNFVFSKWLAKAEKAKVWKNRQEWL